MSFASTPRPVRCVSPVINRPANQSQFYASPLCHLISDLNHTWAQLYGCQNVTREDVSLLVVEDRIVMQKIICRLLVQLGFGKIDTALNGQLALDLIHSKPYDLILSDWNMDEMSGFELLKAVRRDPRSAAIPFVLITAEAKSANIEAAEQAGASGYLIKPFKLAELKTMIESILGPTKPGSSLQAAKQG